MKILAAAQIKEIDNYTIAHEPIKSIDLMERAATAFTEWFISRFGPKSEVCIVCGNGNNGGDGLAIGRLLLQMNYKVEVFAIKTSAKASEDFRLNEEKLKKLAPVTAIASREDIPDLGHCQIIIDAIFGSGLSRPVEGLYAEVIEAVNRAEKKIIAVDIASGLFADRHSSQGKIINAAHTVAFQLPKLAFFMPENADFVGSWHVVDIGLMQEAIDDQETFSYLLSSASVSALLRPRRKFSHKGTHGKALIMAGSYGKMGAAVLCGKAALRSGLGLLTMNIPRCGYDIMQAVVPEAMVVVDEGDHYLTSYADMSGYNALGIGPGIGREQETVYSLMQTIQNYKGPMVIDADGLNIISEHPEMLQLLPENTILTPHPKEFERLAGSWADDFEKVNKQRDFSKANKLIIVLKGAHTSISLPSGSIFFNRTGNPGMASGGTGDVLTGMLSALLAQGYLPDDAAKAGVYLHGLAGDLASAAKGEIGLIASDVIDHIPQAFLDFKKS